MTKDKILQEIDEMILNVNNSIRSIQTKIAVLQREEILANEKHDELEDLRSKYVTEMEARNNKELTSKTNTVRGKLPTEKLQ